MREHNIYTQRFSPGSQNRDYQLDFSLCSFQCYNTYLYMSKHPIPWTENHRIQYHGPKTIESNTMDRKTIAAKKHVQKIMHKTIGGSARTNIGSKIKIFQGIALNP